MCRSGIRFRDGGNRPADRSANPCVNRSVLGRRSISVSAGHLTGLGRCHLSDCLVPPVGNDRFYLPVNMDTRHVDEYGIGVGRCPWDDPFWRNIDIYIVVGVWCHYCCPNGAHVDSM